MQSAEITEELVRTPAKVSGFCSLSTLRPGDRAEVQFVQFCSRELRVRLLSMGIVAGQKVEVLRIAPLKDPMTIRVLGSELALRLSEASHILVQRVTA